MSWAQRLAALPRDQRAAGRRKLAWSPRPEKSRKPAEGNADAEAIAELARRTSEWPRRRTHAADVARDAGRTGRRRGRQALALAASQLAGRTGWRRGRLALARAISRLAGRAGRRRV